MMSLQTIRELSTDQNGRLNRGHYLDRLLLARDRIERAMDQVRKCFMTPAEMISLACLESCLAEVNGAYGREVEAIREEHHEKMRRRVQSQVVTQPGGE